MGKTRETSRVPGWRPARGGGRGRAGILAAALLLTGACQPGNELETRTFEVRHLGQNEVAGLVDPYIYGTREGAPGASSFTRGALTVRELPENLDRIAEVLERFDRPPPTVRLHFQVIEADGFTGSDPEIAEIEEELRKLFNFQGYRLAARTVLQTLEGGEVGQSVGGLGYMIQGFVREVRRQDDGGRLTMEIGIDNLFTTTVSVPLGETVVLGSGQLPGGFEGDVRAAILVVRPELVE